MKRFIAFALSAIIVSSIGCGKDINKNKSMSRLMLLALSIGAADRVFPSSVEGLPPDGSRVGPRIALESVTGGELVPGTYTGKRYTTLVSLAAEGTYNFTDCEFPAGIDTVFGGEGVTRSVTLDHCRHMGGLYFEYGGQKNWKITWSELTGEYQGLRPNGLVMGDVETPTPFEVSDTIVENTSLGTPEAHCEAMQSLGGNSMTFIRVRFITHGPYVNDVTGQTASINHSGGDTLFDACEFVEADAFYYTIYSFGRNVLFRNCRIARGMADYFYPNDETTARIEGCTDINTGEPVLQP